MAKKTAAKTTAAKKTAAKKTTPAKRSAAPPSGGRTNPAMAKALAKADEIWPQARQEPITGFQLFPAGKGYIGKLSRAEVVKPQNSDNVYVRIEHTVLEGPLAGRTCGYNRWITGDDPERVMQEQQRLAGDFEIHGVEAPVTASTDLIPALKNMLDAEPVMRFDVGHSTSKRTGQTYHNVYLRGLVENYQLGTEPAQPTASTAVRAAAPSQPSCWGQYDDCVECGKCRQNEQCKAETPGAAETETESPAEEPAGTYSVGQHISVKVDDEVYGATISAIGEDDAFQLKYDDGTDGSCTTDDITEEEETLPEQEAATPPPQQEEPAQKPGCWKQHDGTDAACAKCKIAPACSTATPSGGTEAATSEAPSLPALLAFVDDWKLKKVTQKDRGTAEGVMAAISTGYNFDKENLSTDELDLLERFPQEYAVVLN